MAVSSSTDASASTAATSLLKEVLKTERSLEAIDGFVRELENIGLPPKAGKLKRTLSQAWKMEYASDDQSIQPFMTGPTGPLTVLEGIIHSIRETGEFETVEVKRAIGPFGNTKASLCGRWSQTDGVMRWRPSYMINGRGREVDPPGEAASVNEARISHLSTSCMLLRIPADGASDRGLLVFSPVSLKEALSELKVDDDDA